MAKVGFQKSLNLREVGDARIALNNIGGAGIVNDLLIIRNNLRNISSISYQSLSNGYFFFGADNDFVFTNDDVVGVSTNVSVGTTTLFANKDYYICNSDAKTQFKLSANSSTVGISTIGVTTVLPTNFTFIRKNPVTQENLINFDYPDIEDVETFKYETNIGDVFSETQDRADYASFSITKKYQKNVNTNVTDIINVEGIITISDPALLNANSANLTNSNSPGLFIGTSRAFSDTTSFWTKVGTALSTNSSSVSVEEIYFDGNIQITGITTESATGIGITTFTHKIPIVVNNEQYYLLLRTA